MRFQIYLKNMKDCLTMESNEWINFCEKQIPELKRLYKIHTGNNLDLNNCKTLSEKIQWLKIYDSNKLKIKCSDKLLVRDYCKEKLQKDLFVPILGVWKTFDEIDFNKLPNDYVLKTNHGSHTNIIVKNNKINKKEAKKSFDKWLSKDWSWWGKEMAYYPIDRKIFAEKYVQDKINGELTDYKFLCFNGEPKFVQVINDRNTKKFHLNYYDMNFNFVDISRIDVPNNKNIKDNKPYNFELMKEYAKKLSQDFNFVRVDFYEIDNIVYLSELTFFPASGFLKYKNEKTNLMLGNMLKLN